MIPSCNPFGIALQASMRYALAVLPSNAASLLAPAISGTSQTRNIEIELAIFSLHNAWHRVCGI